MAGTNLKYGKSKALLREFVDAVQSEYSDISAAFPVKYVSEKSPLLHKLCRKDSATTPGDRAGDYPNAVGDICVLYGATGTYTSTWVCTSVTVNALGATTAVTWTQLVVVDGS